MRIRAIPPSRPRERGMALALTLFAVAILSVAGASALVIGSSGIRATRNYRGSTQVHLAAEAGISEALQAINGPGVIDFENGVVGLWDDLYGSGSRAFPPLAGFSYTVVPVVDAGDPANRGRLVATATGTEGVRNVVVANLLRSDTPSTSPGAIYLAQDGATNATFNGNAFTVDGNDRNYTGGDGPGAPVPAIATRNDTNTQEVVGSLNSNQKLDVTGLGFLAGPPTVPSVKRAPAAPSVAQMNQMIDDLLARPGLVYYGASDINGNAVFGTTDAPQITYFNGNGGVTIKGNGNASGAGIMIVEGDLTIQGSFEFKGLILVRGKTKVEYSGDTGITGNATVYGSLWTNDINLVVGGSSITQYSTQALALANEVGGGGALPAPMRVTSLADCAQVAAGTGGCP